jgi:hypothetical protein
MAAQLVLGLGIGVVRGRLHVLGQAALAHAVLQAGARHQQVAESLPEQLIQEGPVQGQVRL